MLSIVVLTPKLAGIAAPSALISPSCSLSRLRFGVLLVLWAETSCCSGEEQFGELDCWDCFEPASPPRAEVRGETRPVYKNWG
jgi:hypothetical protein